MHDYTDEHWDWIRNLINKAETPQPAPTVHHTPRPADAIQTSGDNVYAVTRHDDGLVSYQPLQGMWR